ncbi:MAG: DUF6361 family protein, partial [Wenzhouxiangellaceae bacterium]
FPGTSVLHTRMRYVLFIPWIYREIESWGGGYDVAREARRLEMTLIDALAESDDPHGVIGIAARESLSRTASNSYWAMLTHWGVFVPGRSQGWYHTHFDSLLRRQHDLPHADDPGVVWEKTFTWHPRLPAPPEGFPSVADFELTPEEADFVSGRIQERCAGSLLAWLVLEGSSELAEYFWDDPAVLRAPSPIAETVELARRFSLHVEGAPLLYNLLLAELRHAIQPSDGDAELIDDYRAALAEWAAREAEESVFDPDRLWMLVMDRGGRLPSPQRRFVEAWTRELSEHGPEAVADSTTLRDLIAARERQLKGQRARVGNPGRLLDWGGRTGVGRMSFRWPNVRQLLVDLHWGLGH